MRFDRRSLGLLNRSTKNVFYNSKTMKEQAIQPIEENLWWVIPEQLAGMRKPNPEEIADLRAAGVGAIVSVMDDPSNLDLYQEVELN